jgi:hypothetical protein
MSDDDFGGSSDNDGPGFDSGVPDYSTPEPDPIPLASDDIVMDAIAQSFLDPSVDDDDDAPGVIPEPEVAVIEPTIDEDLDAIEQALSYAPAVRNGVTDRARAAIGRVRAYIAGV